MAGAAVSSAGVAVVESMVASEGITYVIVAGVEVVVLGATVVISGIAVVVAVVAGETVASVDAAVTPGETLVTDEGTRIDVVTADGSSVVSACSPVVAG